MIGRPDLVASPSPRTRAARVAAILAALAPGRRGPSLPGRQAWAAVALVGAATGSAAAQPAPQVLFQASYDRSGGATNVYQGSVATCDPTGSYRLVVDNGVDGTRLVLLNGVKVLDLQKGARQLVKSVALRPTNGLEVQLGGPRGGRIRVTVDGYPHCLGVRLTAPLAGSTMAQPDTLVEGDVDAPGAVGVRLRVAYPNPTAGGAPIDMFVPAATNGRRFAAWLPLWPGTLSVTALAADAAGRTGESSLSFTFAPASAGDDRATHPDVAPTVGFAPLTVTFGCGAAADAEVVMELDVDGDGVVDFDRNDCAAPPYQVTHTYFGEGLYVATMTTRDVSGRSYVQQVPINVGPMPDLGTLWDGFRAALSRGDIETTLGFIAFEAQERYRRVLEDLRADLPAIAGALGGLTPLVIQPEYATATTSRALDGVTELFVVSLIRDGDGLWRIASF